MRQRVRVKDRGWNAMKDQLRGLSRLSITVGVHGQDGARQEGGPNNVVIAGVHEFGSLRVPARPFIRPTFDANAEKYAKQLRGAVVRALRQGGQLRQLLALVAMGVTKDIQQTIRRQGMPPGSFAPLSRRTLARRRRRRRNNTRFNGHLALIDTGQLINSIQWVMNVSGTPAESGGAS